MIFASRLKLLLVCSCLCVYVYKGCSDLLNMGVAYQGWLRRKRIIHSLADKLRVGSLFTSLFSCMYICLVAFFLHFTSNLLLSHVSLYCHCYYLYMYRLSVCFCCFFIVGCLVWFCCIVTCITNSNIFLFQHFYSAVLNK